jgi:hypothetical protein
VLGLDLQLHDLGKTHPIGPVQDGEANIIARFISYRPRKQVFFKQAKLKQHQYGTFILRVYITVFVVVWRVQKSTHICGLLGFQK